MNVNDNVVRKKILSLERGAIFFHSDFEDIATDTAIRQTLSHIVWRDDQSRGIYCYPRSNPALGTECHPPSAEDIAQRIAERDKVKIILTFYHGILYPSYFRNISEHNGKQR